MATSRKSPATATSHGDRSGISVAGTAAVGIPRPRAPVPAIVRTRRLSRLTSRSAWLPASATKSRPASASQASPCGVAEARPVQGAVGETGLAGADHGLRAPGGVEHEHSVVAQRVRDGEPPAGQGDHPGREAERLAAAAGGRAVPASPARACRRPAPPPAGGPPPRRADGGPPRPGPWRRWSRPAGRARAWATTSRRRPAISGGPRPRRRGGGRRAAPWPRQCDRRRPRP